MPTTTVELPPIPHSIALDVGACCSDDANLKVHPWHSRDSATSSISGNATTLVSATSSISANETTLSIATSSVSVNATHSSATGRRSSITRRVVDLFCFCLLHVVWCPVLTACTYGVRLVQYVWEGGTIHKLHKSRLQFELTRIVTCTMMYLVTAYMDQPCMGRDFKELGSPRTLEEYNVATSKHLSCKKRRARVKSRRGRFQEALCIPSGLTARMVDEGEPVTWSHVRTLAKLLSEHNERINATSCVSRMIGFNWLILSQGALLPVPEHRLEVYTTDEVVPRMVMVCFFSKVRNVFFLGRIAIANSHAEKKLWSYGAVTLLEKALASGASICNAFPSTVEAKRVWMNLEPLPRSKCYRPLYTRMKGAELQPVAQKDAAPLAHDAPASSTIDLRD